LTSHALYHRIGAAMRHFAWAARRYRTALILLRHYSVMRMRNVAHATVESG
jgi:hypothetical protein